MQTNAEVNISNHYLLCNYIFSNKTIEILKTSVKRFMSDKEKDNNYFTFINWQKKANELAIFTLYAYDDICLPKKFDIIFQVDKPNNFIQLDFTITQAVFNAWTPLNKISRGHRHVCIVQFNQYIPDIFSFVTFFDKKKTLQKDIQLGFCNVNDFKNIVL